MNDLLLEMLRTPDAQADPYIWGAALLGHFAIGLILTLVLSRIGAWRAAGVVSLVYALAWEGAQLALYGSALSDSAVDAAAVACGAVLAAAAWKNRIAPLVAALAVLGSIGAGGIRRRRK